MTPYDVHMALEASRSRARAENGGSQVSQVPPADSEPSELADAHEEED